MIMTPCPKSQAGGIVLSGTLNKNSYCLVSRNDRPLTKNKQTKKKKKEGLPWGVAGKKLKKGLCLSETTDDELKEEGDIFY